MDRNEFNLSDEDMMALLNHEMNDRLRRRLEENPDLGEMLQMDADIEAILRRVLGKPSPEMVTAYALGELKGSAHALLDKVVELDPALAEEVAATRHFFAALEVGAPPAPLKRAQPPAMPPQIYVAQIQPAALAAGFRSTLARAVLAVAEGIEVSLTLNRLKTAVHIIGSVLADHELAWVNSLVEIWHDTALLKEAPLNAAWQFRCEIAPVDTVEVRLLSPTGRRLIMRELEVPPIDRS